MDVEKPKRREGIAIYNVSIVNGVDNRFGVSDVVTFL